MTGFCVHGHEQMGSINLGNLLEKDLLASQGLCLLLLDLFGSRYGYVTGFCVHGHEQMGSINLGNLLEKDLLASQGLCLLLLQEQEFAVI